MSEGRAKRWIRAVPVAAVLLLHVFYPIGDRTWWGEKLVLKLTP